MNENTKMLIKRVDELINKCEHQRFSENLYDSVAFEVEQLTIYIAGENSTEYKEFNRIKHIYDNYFTSYNKNNIPKIIALLGALKTKLIVEGVRLSHNSNWDEFLNPKIYKTSYKKFIDGYYSESVEAAIKEVNVRLKMLYKKYKGAELDGSILFSNVFSKDPSTALLIAGDPLDTQSGKDEQDGYRFLFMGMWAGIRNPKAHANTQISKEKAVERLIFASMLMNKIDECVKNTGLVE